MLLPGLSAVAGAACVPSCTAFMRWKRAVAPRCCLSMCCAGIRSHRPKACSGSAWVLPLGQASHIFLSSCSSVWRRADQPMAALYIALDVKNEDGSFDAICSKSCSCSTAAVQEQLRLSKACRVGCRAALLCCVLWSLCVAALKLEGTWTSKS